MGHMPYSRFLTKRNMDIYEKRLSGMAYKEIGLEYGISRSRVYYICERMSMIESTFGMEYTDMMVTGRSMTVVDILARRYPNIDHAMIVRAFNRISSTYKKEYEQTKYMWYYDYDKFASTLLEMEYKDLLKIPSCGGITAAILMRIKEDILNGTAEMDQMQRKDA